MGYSTPNRISEGYSRGQSLAGIHQPVQKGRARVADAVDVVLHGGNRHGLVFANHHVVADAQHGHVARHRQPRVDGDGLDARGVGVVEAEHGQRARRLAQFRLQPARERVPVVGAGLARGERPRPLFAVAFHRLGERRMAEFVLVSPSRREPGRVFVPLRLEVLGGHAPDRRVVARDAGHPDVGARQAEVNDADTLTTEPAHV